MWMARIWTGTYKKAVTKWISVTTVIINDWIGHDQSKGFFSYVRSVLMAYVHWKASKAVRPAISSVSLMTLLTSDHLKCCSAVIISTKCHRSEQYLSALYETSILQQMQSTEAQKGHATKNFLLFSREKFWFSRDKFWFSRDNFCFLEITCFVFST